MNIRALTFGDETRDVLCQLMATSVLGQLNIKGVRGRTASCGTKVCAPVTGKFNFVLLSTCECCLLYGLPDGPAVAKRIGPWRLNVKVSGSNPPATG